MSRGNFPLAEAMLQSYRPQRGVTPEYLEALSWLARGDLITRQFDKADANAKETERLALAIARHASFRRRGSSAVGFGCRDRGGGSGPYRERRPRRRSRSAA